MEGLMISGAAAASASRGLSARRAQEVEILVSIGDRQFDRVLGASFHMRGRKVLIDPEAQEWMIIGCDFPDTSCGWGRQRRSAPSKRVSRFRVEQRLKSLCANSTLGFAVEQNHRSPAAKRRKNAAQGASPGCKWEMSQPRRSERRVHTQTLKALRLRCLGSPGFTRWSQGPRDCRNSEMA